jgi:NAD(P)-dependent dehydrogenase (short-subunit alcohol dehydrogenase family)
MRVGVVGATGGLGRSIASRLEAAGAVVVTVDPRRLGQDSTGLETGPAAGSADAELGRLLATLQALVVAAPLTDVAVHRMAVRNSCHVVDVNVGELNRALLTLDEEAVEDGRSVVAMAGLAPGLTGLLGGEVLSMFEPAATRVCVALLQSPTGAAGVQGARDMLDLLTAPDAGYRLRPVQDPTGPIWDVPLFGLPNAEPEISGCEGSGRGPEAARSAGTTQGHVHHRTAVTTAPVRNAAARYASRRRVSRRMQAPSRCAWRALAA